MELQVANQPVPGRECGTCTMCCKLPSLHTDDGYVKPLNVWCKDCSPGQGCNIYEDRPIQCKNFFCAWLSDPDWPENLPPHKTGCFVKVEYGTDNETVVCRVHENRPAAYQNIEKVLYAAWCHNVAVIVFDCDGFLRSLAWDRHGKCHTIIRLKVDPKQRTHPIPLITFDLFTNEYHDIAALTKVAHEQAHEKGLDVR